MIEPDRDDAHLIETAQMEVDLIMLKLDEYAKAGNLEAFVQLEPWLREAKRNLRELEASMLVAANV